MGDQDLPQIVVDVGTSENNDQNVFRNELSEGQKRIDEITGQTSSDIATTYSELSSWYIANQATILAAESALKDPRKTERYIANFEEMSDTVIKGLEGLSNIHPYISVAVVAFKLVVTLDLTRRTNNKKVVALKLVMQQMMITLFQLRDIHDTKVPGPDGTTLEDRMSSLVKDIAKDISEAGSACDHYLKKSFWVKTLKASIYESRLTEYANRFTEHRTEIQSRLALHTAHGVVSANEKLDAQQVTLSELDQKLDMLLVFEKLDSPKERNVRKYLAQHAADGKLEALIENDTLLQGLVDESGEDQKELVASDSTALPGLPSLTIIRRILTNDLSEDVDKAMKRNLAVYERKLKLHQKQMQLEIEDTIRSEGNHIILTLLSGAHDLIKDKNLREIWKAMGWKGSVKARHFVLALQDYFADTIIHTEADNMSAMLSNAGTPTTIHSNIWPPAGDYQDDRWTLSYINLAHVQPILEAIDDDGTGFISIREVNAFTKGQPAGWSLPSWLTYWSEGWHASVDRYRHKIYQLLIAMHEESENVLPLNQVHLYNNYWSNPVFDIIDRLMRSTKPISADYLADHRLMDLARSYSEMEEKRIEANLDHFKWVIDDSSTLRLITGPGRIERHIYPLLYLILRRHAVVIHIATQDCLEQEEFTNLAQTLEKIGKALKRRVEDVATLLQHTTVNGEERLGHYAFGMFKSVHEMSALDIREVASTAAKGNSIHAWSCDDPSIPEEVNAELKGLYDHATVEEYLKGDTQNDLWTDAYFHDSDIVWDLQDEETARGAWSMLMYRDEEPDGEWGLFQLWFPGSSSMDGKGQNYSGVWDLWLLVGEDKSVQMSIGDRLVCSGTFDPLSQVISGTVLDKETQPISEENRTFVMTRTPTHLHRFRPALSHPLYDIAKARWNFALSAILYQLRRKSFHQKQLHKRFVEQNKFFSLIYRAFLVQWDYSPVEKLSTLEEYELNKLRCILYPPDACFFMQYRSIRLLHYANFGGYGCDTCGLEPLQSKLTCLTCIDDNWRMTMDFCIKCTDTVPEHRIYKHDLSHLLLKTDHLIPDRHLPWMIPTARIVGERVKSLFRSRNAECVCCCCNSRVSLPCYVCVKCTPDTYICDSCEKNKTSSKQDGSNPKHVSTHALIRVLNSNEIEKESADQRIDGLEKQLKGMEEMFDARFRSMEALLTRLMDSVPSSR